MKKNTLFCLLLTSLIAFSGCAAREKSELPNAAPGSAPTASEPQKIGLDDALDAALKHAGLDRDQVVLDRSKLELDDGVWEYELEFTSNSHEYEYTINAVSGEIIKFSLENLPQQSGGSGSGSGSGTGIGSSGGSSTPQNTERITEAQAKEIALDHAEVSASEAVFTKSKLELDDNIWVYEFEFYTNSCEYEYKINAVSGKVLEYSFESIPHQGSGNGSGSGTNSGSGSESSSSSSSDSQQGSERITEAQAQRIALDHAGVSASEATFTKSKLEREDNIWVYEFEFYTNSCEYEYKINAVSGRVLVYSFENKPIQGGSGSASGSGSSTGRLSELQAKDIAMKHAGVSGGTAVFKEFKLETDNGIWEYEIEFFADGSEFEYKLNAVTGAVLGWEMDGYSHHCGSGHCTHYPSSYHHGDDHHWDDHH